MAKRKPKVKVEDDVRAVLAIPEGRRLLRWLIFDPAACGLMSDPYQASDRDTNHALGRQSIAYTLVDVLEAAAPGSTLEVLASPAPASSSTHTTDGEADDATSD